MSGRPSTQEVVFGGLMAALTIALAAPLGPLLPSVLALPVALAFVRHGPRSALWSALVATGGCLMFYDLVTVTAFIIPSGILAGLALGWGAWRRWPALPTVALVTAANAAGYAADWYLGVLVLHHDPAVQFQATVSGGLALLRSLVPLLAPLINLWEPYLRQGIVASALAYSATMSIAAYVVALIVFRRLGRPLPLPPPLSRLRLPRWTALLLVAAFALSRVTLALPGGTLLQAAAANMTLICYPPFALQGLLTALVLARGAGLRRAQALGLLLLLLILVGSSALLGLADSLFGLRRRARPPA